MVQMSHGNFVFNSGPQVCSGPSFPKHVVKVRIFSKDLINKCIIIHSMNMRIHTVNMDLSISNSRKIRTFTAFFAAEGPLQTCGPELKTKLHDPFEPFSASYHVLVV